MSNRVYGRPWPLNRAEETNIGFLLETFDAKKEKREDIE